MGGSTNLSLTIPLLFPYYCLTITILFPYRSHTVTIHPAYITADLIKQSGFGSAVLMAC